MKLGVDAKGIPTSNPSDILFGGGLCPLGGADELTGSHKGYCLSFFVEMLTGPSFISGSYAIFQLSPMLHGRCPGWRKFWYASWPNNESECIKGITISPFKIVKFVCMTP